MGKKKQKVRWTAVEETFFSSAEDSCPESRPAPPASAAAVFKQQQQQQHHPYGHPRRHNNWGSAPVAPRFERRAHHRGHPRDSESDVHTELLPDGFTKIRSKNLDVLFKRDYYAQKTLLEASRSTGSSVRGEGDEEASDDEGSSNKSHTEADVSTEGDGVAGEATAKTAAKDAQDEDVANGHDKASVADDDSAATSPYYLNQQFAYAPTYVGPQNPARTNLFLYSPSSNTMIPCEEIIIPNPVLGPDGGPLYQGPSNIYLAFPMENNGAGGTAVIPQPYMSPPQHAVPYDQYGVPYPPQAFAGAAMCAPVPVMSSDASMYHSSSSDGSSTEPSSADSTMPHSPPDLSAYSPATWVEPIAHFDQGMVSPSYLANQIAEHQNWYQNNNSCAVTSEPSLSAPTQEKRVVVVNRTEDKDDGTARNTSGIPGLHPEDRVASSRRVQKKKKRKKKPVAGASNEKRGSTSSEDNFDSPKSNDSTESPELDDAEQDEVEIGQQKMDAEEAPLITVSPPEQSNGASVRERFVDAAANKESSEQPHLIQSTCSSVTSSPNPFSAPEAACDSREESVSARPQEFPNSKHSEIAVNRKACDDVGVHDNNDPTAPTGDALTCLRKAASSEEAADSTQGATHDVDTCNTNSSRGSFAQSHKKFASDKNKNKRRGANNPASFSQTPKGKPSLRGSTAAKENVKSGSAAPNVPKAAEQRTDADGWEVQQARNKKSKGRRLAMPAAEVPLMPVLVEEVVAPMVQACRLVEEVPPTECNVAVPVGPAPSGPASAVVLGDEAEDKDAEENSGAADEASKKKRNKKRKMQQQDAPRPCVRQVLIQDGQFQVTSYRQKKSASEMLDEDLLAEAIRRGQLDALYISSIGHGMLEGPMTVGRFGQCRYTPPDRSDEIPIELRTMPPEKTEEMEDTQLEEEEEVEPKETEATSEATTEVTAVAQELSLD